MSAGYYQPPEPVAEREGIHYCETCEKYTDHNFVWWFRTGCPIAECLDCGHETDIEQD